jgi:hypothetical protein
LYSFDDLDLFFARWKNKKIITEERSGKHTTQSTNKQTNGISSNKRE